MNPALGPHLAAIVDEFVRIVESVPQYLALGSRYDTPEELAADLRDHADRMRRGDTSRLADFRYLLAPTGELHEDAIESGWSDAYMTLANRFDIILDGDQTPPAPQ